MPAPALRDESDLSGHEKHGEIPPCSGKAVPPRSTPMEIRLVFEGDDPLKGRIVRDGEENSFEGWVDLLSHLERLASAIGEGSPTR